ncbi:hypothetical protein TIFTF001_020360 [Ficus carica]|uniref:Uncharacterized protein n=1 Tax=Ficus carica TaxID=3494 RepID=A0AA88ATX5_FICCA|nr:hypothetical protein TIFTF001_020360 [Ficus carica]
MPHLLSLSGVADGLLKGRQNYGSHRSSEEASVARSPRWARRRGTNLRGNLCRNLQRRASRSSMVGSQLDDCHSGLDGEEIRHWAYG